MKTVRMLQEYHKRLQRGHLWAWRNDFAPGTFDGVGRGECVRVESRDGDFIGVGFANGDSHIAVRIVRWDDAPVDEAFIRERLARAVALRDVVRRGDETFRAVFGESDGLPGLAADKYGRTLVLSQTVAGLEPWTGVIADALAARYAGDTVVLRNTNRIRALEGLPIECRVMSGTWSGPVEVDYDGFRVLADCAGGRKTGLFLDHRENRRLLAGLLSGGETVLDLFSHVGLWSLALMSRGAARADCLDSDGPAAELGAESARRNGWAGKVRFHQADAMEFLRAGNADYDVVVLDPPAFAKKKRFLKEGLELYRDFNAAALARVKPWGLFVSSSCSSFVEAAVLDRLVGEAAAGQGLRLQRLATGTQALDHPVLAAMPETSYLKCLFYRRMG